ncbi:putative bifunctional diguanylate cyclase/phosphodiesterase [Photobacterium kishitanii]|uniref:EAL domain-containing protein n=1 Tax=Photobacterium kishitanii TaxID=318456 RepID=A0A2T3KMY2_9GAMM|nr:GGDEF domain-containing phosphodiesterase [Photobacterium kishitanii]PSV01159.1 hypothetical protein C9J27_03810 [Photobacterium kishitanii]
MSKSINVLYGGLAAGALMLQHSEPTVAFACNAALLAAITTSSLYNRSQRGERSHCTKSDFEEFRAALNKEILDEDCKDTSKSDIYVVSMDIQKFKTTNAKFGYDCGDIILNKISNELIFDNNIKASCRLSADVFYFVILTENSDSLRKKIASLIENIAKRVPSLNGEKLKLSVGYCNHSWHIDDMSCTDAVSSLISHADIARIFSKKNNTLIEEYRNEYGENAVEKLSLEYDLEQSIEKGEISVLYQPKVSIKTGLIEGVEALCRWTHNEKGLISPAFFIPLAEESGYVNKIGEYVIYKAIADLADIHKRTGTNISMAINVSIKQFETNQGLDLKRQIFDTCDMYKIPHNKIQLEITETTAAKDLNKVVSQLEYFKGEGFGISLDDFGVGHSSLFRLKSLPLSQVKIDRAFVIDRTDTGQALLQNIQDISRTIDVEVVAEGVETAEQFQTVKSLGCDYIQGFLVSKPIKVDKLISMIKKGKIDLDAIGS